MKKSGSLLWIAFSTFISIALVPSVFAKGAILSLDEGITAYFVALQKSDSESARELLVLASEKIAAALGDSSDESIWDEDRLAVFPLLKKILEMTSNAEVATENGNKPPENLHSQLSQTLKRLQEQSAQRKTNPNDFGRLDFQVPRFRVHGKNLIPAKVIRILQDRVKEKTSPDLAGLSQKITINGLKLSPEEQKILTDILKETGSKPEAEGRGQNTRLPDFGYLFGQSTEKHQELFAFAAPSKPVSGDLLSTIADIGCGYGTNTHLALGLGEGVVAIDLFPSVLSVLVQSTNRYLLDRLEVSVGKLPDQILLQESSLKGILLSHVAHYLSPQVLMDSLKLIFRTLEDQGRFYLFAITPYYGKLTDEEIESIENVVRASSSGFLGDLNHPNMAESFPTYTQYLYPEGYITAYPRAAIYHPLLPEVASQYLKKVGFAVLDAKNYLSSMVVSQLVHFEKSGRLVGPRFISQTQPNPRQIGRVDFEKFREKIESSFSKDEIFRTSKILGKTRFLWPIFSNPYGGDMYVVGVKGALRSLTDE